MEIALIGSIIVLCLVIGITLTLEQFELYSFPLSSLFPVYVIIALISGFAWSFFRGPKDFSLSEKQDPSLMKLYKDPKYLVRWYSTIKKSYENEIKRVKKDKARQSVLNRRESMRRNFVLPEVSPIKEISKEEVAEPSEEQKKKKKKKKRKWGLTESEFEERKSIFSLRFLSKVARLKTSSDEDEDEEQQQKNKVLCVDPDQNFIHQLTTAVQENYIVQGTIYPEEAIQLLSEFKPNIIICESSFPETEDFQVVSDIKKNLNGESIPIVIMNKDETIDKLVKSRQVEAADFWMKIYNDNEVEVKMKEIVSNINFILNNDPKALLHLLDTKIIKAEKEEKNSNKDKRKTNTGLIGKVLIASRDYTLISIIQDKLTKLNCLPITIVDPKSVVATALLEKAQIIIIDDTISKESILRISKMLNIRIASSRLVLITSEEMGIQGNAKVHDLKVMSHFVRPFDVEKLINVVMTALRG